MLSTCRPSVLKMSAPFEFLSFWVQTFRKKSEWKCGCAPMTSILLFIIVIVIIEKEIIAQWLRVYISRKTFFLLDFMKQWQVWYVSVCVLLSFVQLSAWTLILLTLERCIAVVFPLQCKRLITLRRVVIAWCLIVVVLFGANSHFFGTAGLFADDEVDDGGLDCHVYGRFQYFLRHQWYWINAILGDFFPCLVIIVGNIAIFTTIAIRKRRIAALNCQSRCDGKLVTGSRVSKLQEMSTA